ncbi:MAG: hypothetical protein AAGF11_27875 [Myxococcota bacterium]
MCIINGIEKSDCFDSLAQAQASCGSSPGNGVVGNAPMPCDNHTPDPGVSWKPGSFVAYDETTHAYEIDRQFMLDILDDPNMLLLDRARLGWRTDHFAFENIADGDIADLLGFIDGDALSEINGYPLSTLGEIAKAYESLQEESSLTVTFVRGQATLMHTYHIVDDD